MRLIPSLSVLILSCFVLPACHADDTATQAQVDALVKKTLNHLSFVEGGSFMMGDFGPEHGEEKLPFVDVRVGALPTHQVTLDSFSMMQYKATYVDLDVYSAANHLPKVAQYIFATSGRGVPTPPADRQAGMPAQVNWQPARDYCQWLGKLTGLPFDLPTEAQWEYAARNRGQFVLFATDNGKIERGRNVPTYEQQKALQGEGGYSRNYPVGLFPPSPLGLYDMGYNGMEWILDWYAVDYYQHSPEHNPTGPTTGTEKVTRGDRGLGSTAWPTQELTIWRYSSPLFWNPASSTITPEELMASRGQSVVRCVVNAPQRLAH